MNIRVIQVVCLLFLGLFSANAQVGPGKSYSVTKDTTYCNKDAAVIRLGEDVLGIATSAGGGVWNELEVNGTDTTIVATNVSSLFIALNRMPGVYYFEFTAKNNPCMPDGDKALAKITIVENPLSSNVTLLLCDEAITLNLINYLAPALSDLTIEFKDEAGTVLTGGTYNVTADFEGDINFSYTIQDAGYVCNTAANLTVIVERNVDVSTLPTSDTLNLCQTAIPNQVSLSEILDYYIPGAWANDAASTEGVTTAPTPVADVITLADLDITALPAKLVYTLTPSGTCYSGYNPTAVIVITDDLEVSFENVEYDACKTSSPVGYIDLMSLLDVDLPVRSGEWFMVSHPEGSAVDIQDGVFEFKDSRVGQYVCNFIISNAATMCGLTGDTAQVTLNIFDSSEALDGEVQLCAAATGTLTLSDYIVGLPATGVEWAVGVTSTGTPVVGGSVDVSNLSVGVHAYTYSYAAGPCANAEGVLYVTVADEITNFSDKTIKYCLTDNGSDAIDLNQVLGVFGLAGTWSNDDAAVNFADPIFDGRAEGVGTYKFTFTAGEDYCSITTGDTVTITVIITEDLAN